jgi:hypothetical protein
MTASNDRVASLPSGFDAVIGHAWAWYSLHAGQRMQMINFFLAAGAFLTAGYATAQAAHSSLVAGAIALVGVVVSIVFNLFDARTRELIVRAEPAVASLQRILSDTGIANVEFLLATHSPMRRAPSYRFGVTALTSLGLVGFGVAAVVSFTC